jgi:cyclase
MDGNGHFLLDVCFGAGEILVQSVDRDSRVHGYDAALVGHRAATVAVPVVALGGAGQIIRLKDAFDRGAPAGACVNLFNFGDNNPLRAKALLKNYSVPLKKT